MGLFGYVIAGGGFILLGAWESLTSKNQPTQTPSQKPPSKRALTPNLSPSLLSHIFAASFSILFIINSLISISSAISSKDRIGSPLQFQVLAISSLFFLYSLLGFFSQVSNFIHFPSKILDLVVLFAFVEEFLLFYLQRKDTIGIENRYYDLMLLPVSICVVSTLLVLKSDQSSSLYPRLARGVGLILQGMWFLQMGVSFYTNWMVKGCNLIEKSRGNFTIKCKGHMEYHRGRAIATLLFNCYLALIVVVIAGVYSVVANKDGDRGGFLGYKPLGEEMVKQMEIGPGQFTLDSDEEDEIREVEENVAKSKAGGAVEMSVNGFGSH